MVWSAVLPAVATLGAAYIGNKGAKKRNQEAQAASAKQMTFQEDMSNTSYQRGMDDMKKAGLNPILAGRLGGASTPTGSTYNPENTMLPAVNASTQVAQAVANIEQTEANTGKILAETDILKNSQGSFMGRNVEFLKKEADKVISSVKEKSAIDKFLDKIKARLNKAKTKQIMKQINKSGSKTIYKGKTIYPDRILRTKWIK